jgi:hypothetical protein
MAVTECGQMRSTPRQCDRMWSALSKCYKNQYSRSFGNCLVITSCPLFRLALRVHSHCRARRQAVGYDTDPAANQFGAPDSANTRVAHFRLWPMSVPRVVFGSLDRRTIMRTIDTLPGESNGSIISSIINLVCPQCGGRMSSFQCEGRCRRSWLEEWEWANRSSRSSRSRLSGHAGRSRL